MSGAKRQLDTSLDRTARQAVEQLAAELAVPVATEVERRLRSSAAELDESARKLADATKSVTQTVREVESELTRRVVEGIKAASGKDARADAESLSHRVSTRVATMVEDRIQVIEKLANARAAQSASRYATLSKTQAEVSERLEGVVLAANKSHGADAELARRLAALEARSERGHVATEAELARQGATLVKLEQILVEVAADVALLRESASRATAGAASDGRWRWRWIFGVAMGAVAVMGVVVAGLAWLVVGGK